jgi:hypothetical protein
MFMSPTATITGLAICFAILIFLAFFGKKIDAAFAQRKRQKVLRRENAKPVLFLNGGTHLKVGKMRVVVWAPDFFEFASAQHKKGSDGMYYAPVDKPGAVFTQTGFMPDGSPATGGIQRLETILREFGDRVRVENRCDLFIPQVNERYADFAWQKRNCGVITSWNLEEFVRRFYDIARAKAT